MNDCECKKDNEKCVCVNIFVKCDKKDAYGNEMWEKKDCLKDDCCVRVNVFAECNKKN